jgi:antitoxin ParD1/3/4
MTLHVSLPDGLEKLVNDEVAKGMYATASEVVREALRQFFTKEEEPAWIAPEMRRRVEAMDRGEYAGRMIDGETFFAQLEQQYP